MPRILHNTSWWRRQILEILSIGDQNQSMYALPVWSETVNQKHMWLWLPDCVQGGCSVIRRIRKTDNHRIAQHLSLLWHSKPLNDQQTKFYINSKFYIFREWSYVPSFSTSFCSQEFSLSQARVTGAHICNRTEAAVETNSTKLKMRSGRKVSRSDKKGTCKQARNTEQIRFFNCRLWRSFNLMCIMYTRWNLPTDTNFWWRHLLTLNTKHYKTPVAVSVYLFGVCCRCVHFRWFGFDRNFKRQWLEPGTDLKRCQGRCCGQGCLLQADIFLIEAAWGPFWSSLGFKIMSLDMSRLCI